MGVIFINLFYGIFLSTIIGVISLGLKTILPLGSVTISLIIGIAFANTVGVPLKAKKGVVFTEKKILSAAITLLGFSLNYTVLLSFGLLPVILILTGVPITIFTALIIGRFLGVEKELSLLVGTGNGICGSSAIASAQSVINTKEEHVGVSIAVINLLGTLGILLLPIITSLFPSLTSEIKGMIIGNTLQAVGQVTAAGYSVGEITGQTAIIIKMGRILLLTPVILIYSFKFGNKSEKISKSKGKIIGLPPFIVLFILFSLINTIINIPEAIIKILMNLKNILLTIAMAGIGLKISFKGVIKDGYQALILGIGTWFIQIVYTISLSIFLL